MKAFYFFLFLPFFYTASFSQDTRFNRRDSTRITEAKQIQYTLESFEKSDLTIKLPFSKITFFDVRFDTSFVAINWQENVNFKYNLKDGLETSLTSYLTAFYRNNLSNNDAEIVCYIKKFSVNPKGSIAISYNASESVNNIRLETECYYKCDGLLFPALRIDTFYSGRSTRIKTSIAELTKEILLPLIEKLSGIDSTKIRKRHVYTLQQIQDRYQQRFNLPILTTTQYKKGVYKNFQEFINNAPSITEFTVSNKSVTISIYDSKGKDISSRVFGFCDGETCWIQGGGFCSPLTRVGNSFEFFYRIYLIGDLFLKSKKFLLVINMEYNGDFLTL